MRSRHESNLQTNEVKFFQGLMCENVTLLRQKNILCTAWHSADGAVYRKFRVCRKLVERG